MSRWQAMVVAVALFAPADAIEARVIRPCRAAIPATAFDGVGGGDWSNGYVVDFGYLAVSPKANGAGGQAVSPTTGLLPAVGPISPPAPPPRLHLLILVDDTNKDAGPANKAGAALLEKTTRAGISQDRLGTVETLSGPAVTLDQIRGRIKALGIRPRDAVIGFYSGAAEYDESTGSYMLAPANGSRFRRAELRDLLIERGAALTVVLTDTPAYRVVPEMVPPFQPQAGPFSLDRLVFGYRGVVDLQAAAANETAFPRDGEGGLFTLALVDELRQLKADGPDPVWPTLFQRIRAATDRMYVDYRRAVLTSDKITAEEKRIYREQPHQTPTALTPFDRVKAAPLPGGANVVTIPKPGEIVVRVPAGSKVFVEDRPTKLVGPERHFETAELQPGRAYTYAIRAELDRDGRALNETKRVTVRAGETVEVRFELKK
jgi:uncharacterized protein (TIGR03000 family)